MAVPGRNRTLFRCVFRSLYCVQTALAWGIKGGAHTRWVNSCHTYHIYTACTSPILNESSALEWYKRSNAIEIENGIMFDFYPGLPHM